MLCFTHYLASTLHIESKGPLLRITSQFNLTLPVRVFSLQDVANCNRNITFTKKCMLLLNYACEKNSWNSHNSIHILITEKKQVLMDTN